MSTTGNASGSAPGGDAPAPRRWFGRRGPTPEAAPARREGRSILRVLGPHFVIAPPEVTDGELSAAMGGLRPVPDALVVVAAATDAAPVLREQMAELGMIARARGASSLILAASGLAAVGPGGRRPAEVVADKAGITVVAPDGMVAIQPDGTLKVTAPNGSTEPATWWSCPPGGRARRLRETVPAAAPVDPGPALPGGGAPHVPPVPPVERAVAPAGPGALPVSVSVHRLATGFWLNHVTARPEGSMPFLQQLATPPGTTPLLVGTPDRPALDPQEFTEAALSLPVGSGQLMVSAPWADPGALALLSGSLAERLGRPVHAAVGLPVAGSRGYTTAVLDHRGAASWEPFLLRLSSSGPHRTVSSAWRKGTPSWETVGPGLFRAFPFWCLEAVPAGLWLRPEPPYAWAPRFLRPDPARPLIVVGEQARLIPHHVWEELGALLDEMPGPGARGFGLLLHGLVDSASESSARFFARMHGLVWLNPPARPATGDPAGALGPDGAAHASYALNGSWAGAVPAPVTERFALPAPGPQPTVGAADPASGTATGAPVGFVTGPVAPAESPVCDAGATPGFTTAAAAPGSPAEPAEPAVGVPTVPAGFATSAGMPGAGGTPTATPTAATGAVGSTGQPGQPGDPGATRQPAASGGASEPATTVEESAAGAPGEPTTAALGIDQPTRHTVTGGAPRPDTRPDAPAGEFAGEFAAEAPTRVGPAQVGPTTATAGSAAPGPWATEAAPPPEPSPHATSAPGPEPEPEPVSLALAAHYFTTADVPPLPPVSAAADRDAFRAMLGEHYHRCAGRVEPAVTRLPGLRSTGQDDFKADLVAVLLHHEDSGLPADRAALLAEARGGTAGPLRPYLACLRSGLRRLPSHHGAVLLGAELAPEALEAFPVGLALVEPGPIAGLASPAVQLGTPVEFVVWSTTGRRTAAFGDDGEVPQVAFPPGTGFVVVDVVPGEGAARPARVLLREAAGPGAGPDAERDDSARKRLHAWLERRDKVAPADRRTVARPERFRLTPGALLPEPPAAPAAPPTPDPPAES
ncbi:hypothetical protein ACFV0O_03985 [Kitasatospora sp. NPDC059577]|uniref:hypothetical protein n=1 Tax=Kitasatospora sp. NPDC059577 TaxID=3346873 RepID=UPI0036AE38B4